NARAGFDTRSAYWARDEAEIAHKRAGADASRLLEGNEASALLGQLANGKVDALNHAIVRRANNMLARAGRRAGWASRRCPLRSPPSSSPRGRPAARPS